MADRNQGALAAVAAEEEEVVVFESDAEVVAAPERGVESLMGHDVDDLHVALLVAALEGIFGVEFGRVVGNAELGLDPVLRHVHFGARNEGVAADGGHLFKEDDVRTGVLRFDRGREARAARTDHDDVIGGFFREVDGGFLDGLLVGLRERHARLLGGVLNGVEEALRGEGGARDNVEVRGVRLNDVVLHFREDLLRENGVFLVLHDLDVGDAAFVERDGNRNVAVLADPGAFLSNGGGKSRDGEKTADRGGKKRGTQLHDVFSPTWGPSGARVRS